MNYLDRDYQPWHFKEIAPNANIKCPTCDQYYYNLVKLQEKTKQLKKQMEGFQQDCAMNTRHTVLEGEFSAQRMILTNTKKDAQIDAKNDEINSLQTHSVHMQAKLAQQQKQLIDLETELKYQENQALLIANQAKQQEALIDQLQHQVKAEVYRAQENKEQAQTLRENLQSMQLSYDSQVDQLRHSLNNYETSAAMRDFVAERILAPSRQLEDDAFEI